MASELMTEAPGRTRQSVCPAEDAGWLSTPFRRLVTNPRRILGDLVSTGDTVVDLGCGPGFFTLPLAEMVGDEGSVIAVDLQQAMLDKLGVRAEREGLASRIHLHRCEAGTLGLDGEPADFALAFWMVHEVPDQWRFFQQTHDLLRSGARLLLVEPMGHVVKAAFAQTLSASEAAGFRSVGRPRIFFSHCALLERD
jgi:ubiquinone/menaquinone biosynthesis C-methylase UbiE